MDLEKISIEGMSREDVIKLIDVADFPNLFARISVEDGYERAIRIINREGWSKTLFSILAALNHLECSLVHD